MILFFVTLVVAAMPVQVLAVRNTASEVFEMKLHEAEKKAMNASFRLKSFVAEESAATDQASAQLTNLYPKLSLQGSYEYYGTIPKVAIGNFPPIPFGTNSTYSVGPSLSYTLWDTFSARRTYQAASLLASARAYDRKAAEIELLTAVRAAYVQVQLGMEELRLINDTLGLSAAQNHDVLNRFHAGAAATIDVVTAGRSVLSYKIQLRQKQAELASALKDLLALIGNQTLNDISAPGPAGIENVTLELRLDSLEDSLGEESAKEIPEPTDGHPQLQSLTLQARSSDLSAESQSAKLYPQITLNGGVAYTLPYMPDPPRFWQETVGATLTIPLFLGDPSGELAAHDRSEAQATGYRKAQLKDDILRDFKKARNLLESLKEQKRLAGEDVVQSEKAAKLYYASYRAGKVNLIDVQNANVQALESKVNAARIDAQILNQLILLKSLSGTQQM